ncbi:hypothetical protein VTN31DRAFT_3334 [Thermomyces dupontii]|uniref:uncharacterized protein n=1 Tax=Talaromyces thermophilus TaxID=28565 RepID=UPI003743CD05
MGSDGHDTSPWSRPPFHHSRTPSSPPLRPNPISSQTQRLRLRNARFRGPNLSAHKITDRIASWGSSSDDSDGVLDKENHLASSPQSPGLIESTRRRSSILREIRNSSRRSSVSITSSHDHWNPPAFEPDDYRPHTPPYSGRSSIFPPWASSQSPIHDSNQSSPLSQQSEIQVNKRDARSSKVDYETTRYIEHLESQLAAAQSDLSLMQSPSTKPRSSKLRSLAAEVKVLQQEIAEWESKFEARVQEEVKARTEIENRLRSRIVFLEGQHEADLCRIKELECERDLQAQKLRNAEALRSTNRSLERRIDVLTELLAQSPVRVDPPRSPIRDATSPTRSPGPKLSRPRSVVPTLPPRLDPSYQPLGAPVPSSDAAQEHGENKRNASQSDAGERDDADDCTVSSTCASRSQRSSTFSHVSTTSTQFSLPLPFSPELQGRAAGRQRNMRRFPSGSCTLKPLILPNTTASIQPGPQSATQSEMDFDSGCSSDDASSESGGNNRYSVCLAQEATLAALEGRIEYRQTFDEAMFEGNDGEYGTSLEESSSVNGIEHGRRRLSSPSGASEFSRSLGTPSSVRTRRHHRRRSSISDIDQRRISQWGQVLTETYREWCTRFGTIAHCIVASVWSRSTRRLWKISWWVLGLVLGSQQRDDLMRGITRRSTERHGRASRHDSCPSSASEEEDRPATHTTTNTTIAAGGARQGTVSCRCSHAPWCRQLAVARPKADRSLGEHVSQWAKFSIALIVAVGLAIRYGPESLLEPHRLEPDQVDDEPHGPPSGLSWTPLAPVTGHHSF